jgi:hypothetical protein
MTTQSLSVAGVEFAGALEDFLHGDLARMPGYRHLMPYVQVPSLQNSMFQ